MTTPAPTITAGTTIGTAAGAANVFDGSLTTWCDGPAPSGDWVGRDFGVPYLLSGVNFAARPSWEGRATGGVFEAADDAAFTVNVRTLYTIAGKPNSLKLTPVTFPVTTARYARYLGPANGYCNIAEVQFLGTVAPTAAPASQVAPAAAAVPAAPPAPVVTLKCGLGTAATTGPTATSDSLVTWFDVRGCTGRDDGVKWNFGDPTTPARPDPRHLKYPAKYANPTWNPNTDNDGRIAAHVYTGPGTFTATATVAWAAGGTSSATVMVTVAPPPQTAYYIAPGGKDANPGTAAAPWATLAPAVAVLNGKSNVAVHALGGVQLAYAGAAPIRLAANVCVDLGTSTLTSAVTVFDGWDGQTNGAKITDGTVTGGGELLVARGTNIAVIDTVLGNLNRGIEGNDANSHGLLLMGIKQTGTIGSEVLSVWGGGSIGQVYDSVALYGCDVSKGSEGEITVRADGVGAASGFASNFNAFGQPASNGKACLSFRNVSDANLYGDVYSGSPVGLSSTLGSTLTNNTAVRFDACELVGANAYFDVGARTAGVTIANTGIATTTTPGIHLSAPGVSDVHLSGNSGPGNSYHLYGTGTVPGLVSDAPEK